MTQNYKLKVNGNEVEVNADPDTPLLYILRNNLSLKGTKFGCGDGICGACTVILDGLPIFSCDTPIWSIGNKDIETIEGLSKNGPHPLQKALIEEQAGQCGYCLSGITMRIKAITDKNANITLDEIADELDRNLCRCGSQVRIMKALSKYLKEKN